jgi:hypothetical protein
MGNLYAATPGQNPGVARIYIYIYIFFSFLPLCFPTSSLARLPRSGRGLGEVDQTSLLLGNEVVVSRQNMQSAIESYEVFGSFGRTCLILFV